MVPVFDSSQQFLRPGCFRTILFRRLSHWILPISLKGFSLNGLVLSALGTINKTLRAQTLVGVDVVKAGG